MPEPGSAVGEAMRAIEPKRLPRGGYVIDFSNHHYPTPNADQRGQSLASVERTDSKSISHPPAPTHGNVSGESCRNTEVDDLSLWDMLAIGIGAPEIASNGGAGFSEHGGIVRAKSKVSGGAAEGMMDADMQEADDGGSGGSLLLNLPLRNTGGI